MKLYVRAMSTSKKDFKRRLHDISGELTEHLIKLYLYPNSQYANHWRKEVWAFLHYVPKLKHNNKIPTSDFIFNGISIYLDQVESFLYMLMEEYSELSPERLDPDEATSLIEQYFENISIRLSKDSTISSSECIDILIELSL